jgi:hypothetical protein
MSMVVCESMVVVVKFCLCARPMSQWALQLTHVTTLTTPSQYY